MTDRTVPFASAFSLGTVLLRRCVEDLDDRELGRRLAPETNPVAFLVLHVLDARHFLLDLLGRPAEHPFRQLLADARSADDFSSYPPRDEILAAWDAAAEALARALGSLAPGTLAEPSPHDFPGDDPTLAGAITFLALHEAYHVGQLGLLRKALGRPAMEWG